MVPASLSPSVQLGFPFASSQKLCSSHSPNCKTIRCSMGIRNRVRDRRTTGSSTENGNLISDFDFLGHNRGQTARDVPHSPPTPLIAALKISAAKDVARLEFLGYKTGGQAAPSSITQLIGTRPFRYDLTPVPELEGSVLDAQVLAARLFR